MMAAIARVSFSGREVGGLGKVVLSFLEGKVSDSAMAIVEDFTNIFERINFLLVVVGGYFM